MPKKQVQKKSKKLSSVCSITIHFVINYFSLNTSCLLSFYIIPASYFLTKTTSFIFQDSSDSSTDSDTDESSAKNKPKRKLYKKRKEISSVCQLTIPSVNFSVIDSSFRVSFYIISGLWLPWFLSNSRIHLTQVLTQIQMSQIQRRSQRRHLRKKQRNVYQ